MSKFKSGDGQPRIISLGEEHAFKGGRPTLKSIAEICGLAVPTVSRALSGASDIGQSTRDRVRQVADEIGYVPNRAGVRLRTGKTNVISLVLPTEIDGLNYSSRIIASIAGALRNSPYHLIVTPFFPDEDPIKPVRYIVETESADAIIINQIQPEDPRVKYLLERNFPFATHGRSMWAEQHPYFDFDNFEFARNATEQLANRGRKSLLLIAPPLSQNYAQNMISGMQAAAQDAGLRSDYFEESSQNGISQKLGAQITKYLQTHPDIDGVITSTTVSAVESISAIKALGRRLGHDIDVCTKEVAPFFRRIRPEILTITEDVTKAGSFLAKAALSAIDQPDNPPLQLLVAPEENTVRGRTET